MGFTSDSDPFANLPRLSPLPEDIDLIADDAPPTGSEPTGRRRAPDEREPDRADGPAPQATEPPAGYHGRRRATAEQDQSDAAGGGGRRRAPDNAPDDLLSRLRKD